MRHANRLAALEGRSLQRLVVATVAPGSSLRAVAAANGFALQPSDLLVSICKPDGCTAETIKAYGGRA